MVRNFRADPSTARAFGQGKTAILALSALCHHTRQAHTAPRHCWSFQKIQELPRRAYVPIQYTGVHSTTSRPIQTPRPERGLQCMLPLIPFHSDLVFVPPRVHHDDCWCHCHHVSKGLALVRELCQVRSTMRMSCAHNTALHEGHIAHHTHCTPQSADASQWLNTGRDRGIEREKPDRQRGRKRGGDGERGG